MIQNILANSSTKINVSCFIMSSSLWLESQTEFNKHSTFIPEHLHHGEDFSFVQITNDCSVKISSLHIQTATCDNVSLIVSTEHPANYNQATVSGTPSGWEVCAGGSLQVIELLSFLLA